MGTVEGCTPLTPDKDRPFIGPLVSRQQAAPPLFPNSHTHTRMCTHAHCSTPPQWPAIGVLAGELLLLLPSESLSLQLVLHLLLLLHHHHHHLLLLLLLLLLQLLLPLLLLLAC